jgi:hypothetical protein
MPGDAAAHRMTYDDAGIDAEAIRQRDHIGRHLLVRILGYGLPAQSMPALVGRHDAIAVPVALHEVDPRLSAPPTPVQAEDGRTARPGIAVEDVYVG